MSSIITFFQCFFNWNISGTSEDGIDVIVSHAGGETTAGEPGKINEYLSLVVREIHRRTGAPIIAQGELARCLSDLPLVGKIPRQAESQDYIDTVFVTKRFKSLCAEHGFKKPILVSYQPHLWRGLKVCEKLGMDVTVAKTDSVYDKNCSQWWMRSPLLNIPRELLCRILWTVQGKI